MIVISCYISLSTSHGVIQVQLGRGELSEPRIVRKADLAVANAAQQTPLHFVAHAGLHDVAACPLDHRYIVYLCVLLSLLRPFKLLYVDL